MLPLISIAIPILNEAENLPPLYQRLCSLAETMKSKCTLEFVFSDNHSNDETWAILVNIASTDHRVKAIRFSKNYGFQRSILMNYLHTKGDAVMQLDADLQDPPEMLDQFFDLWQQGYHVVYGIRKRRPESPLMTLFRKVGYWGIDKMSEYPVPRNVGDFMLIDRRIIKELARIRVPQPYIRGIIPGFGFKQIGIPYTRNARGACESKFNILQLIKLGFTAIFNQSAVPLRFASFFGGTILLVSICAITFYISLRVLHLGGWWPKGFATIYIYILFGIGLNAFLLGIIGEYLLRIYLVLRNDPIAIIEDSLNFSTTDLRL
jgi:polyisoprenyl-phosphate glycosyltransferase